LAEYHVGVDVSKRKHKACIRNLSQDSYSGVFSFNIDRQGFEKFLGTLEKLSRNKEDFLIGIEATGNYGLTLAYFLLSHGYTVVEINPYRANQFRKAQGKKPRLIVSMPVLWQVFSPWRTINLFPSPIL